MYTNQLLLLYCCWRCYC